MKIFQFGNWTWERIIVPCGWKSILKTSLFWVIQNVSGLKSYRVTFALTLDITMSLNGQARFKNLVVFPTRFIKCVRPFYNIAKWSVERCNWSVHPNNCHLRLNFIMQVYLQIIGKLWFSCFFNFCFIQTAEKIYQIKVYFLPSRHLPTCS